MEQMELLVSKDHLDHPVKMVLKDVEVKRATKVKLANKVQRVKMALRDLKDLKVLRDHQANRVIRVCRGLKENQVFVVKMDPTGYQVLMVYLEPRETKAMKVKYMFIYVDRYTYVAYMLILFGIPKN